MEHISLEDLREQGHIPLAFHRDPETDAFHAVRFWACSRRRQGRSSFTRRPWHRRDTTGSRPFSLPVESRWGEGAKRYPLEFLSRKADNYMNSTFANLEGHRKMEARTSQRLEIHPADAKARGIADGDKLRVWNDRGEIILTALVNGSVPEGVVAGRMDWAKFNKDGVNVNALTSERLTDIGAGATFYSVLVEVAKA